VPHLDDLAGVRLVGGEVRQHMEQTSTDDRSEDDPQEHTGEPVGGYPLARSRRSKYRYANQNVTASPMPYVWTTMGRGPRWKATGMGFTAVLARWAGWAGPAGPNVSQRSAVDPGSPVGAPRAGVAPLVDALEKPPLASTQRRVRDARAVSRRV